MVCSKLVELIIVLRQTTSGFSFSLVDLFDISACHYESLLVMNVYVH
jgi:hypothetical protein